MALSRASTAAFATSASTSTCSTRSSRRARSSKNGGPTTTPTDRTRASTGSRQPSAQHAPPRGKTGTDSPYERGQIGEQVKSNYANSGQVGELHLRLFIVLSADLLRCGIEILYPAGDTQI